MEGVLGWNLALLGAVIVIAAVLIGAVLLRKRVASQRSGR
jgi:preprotein translocase subunit SecG